MAIVFFGDYEEKEDTTSVYILVPRQHRTGANPFHVFLVSVAGVGVFRCTVFNVIPHCPFV